MGRKETWLIMLALVFLGLGLTYSLVTPSFEAPDEVGHFYYAVHLLTHKALPVQTIGVLGEAHQPPLYYALVALFAMPADLNDRTGQFIENPEFMWAGRGGNAINIALHDPAERLPLRGHALALHLARFASVLMGTFTVILTGLIGWRLWPERPAVGLLAAALVAFNPQFLFISGAVNNDNLLVMLSTLALWQILKTMPKPEAWQSWAWIGALMGAGFLAKVNGGLVIGALAGLALLLCALERRSLRLLFKGMGAMLIASVLVSGWWFARNQLLYGDVFGWQVFRQVFAVTQRSAPLQLSDIRTFLSTQFRSFWGVFGWMNVLAPWWYYRFWQGFCLLGGLGLGLQVWRVVFQKYGCGLQACWMDTLRRFKDRRVHVRDVGALSTMAEAVAQNSGGAEPTSCTPDETAEHHDKRGLRVVAWEKVVMVAAVPVLQEAYMMAVITQCNESCYQGRYLFPAIAAINLMLAWGLTAWVPQRYVSLLAFGIGMGVAALACWVPAGVIAPAYAITWVP